MDYSRLIKVDESTFGLIGMSHISFFSVDAVSLKVTLIDKFFFNDRILLDACADKSRNLFVLFTFENKIIKFNLNLSNPNRLVMIRSITEHHDSYPTAISCTENYIYVSSRLNNQLRVYDLMLNLLEKINISNVIVSIHNNLAIDSNVKVVTDGLDGVGLLLKNNMTCHFYSNMMCIEDIDVYNEKNSSKSSIYVVDSCEKNVKQFIFSQDEKILLKNVYNISTNEKILSATRISHNILIVFTKYPTKITLLILN